METINCLASEFSSIEAVEALALSGSQTAPLHDDSSDFDLYIYSKERLPLAARERIFSSISNKFRINCSLFEEGDELYTAEGFFDLMYRSAEWAENEVESVWRKHKAKLGYTTAFLFNIQRSKLLFDKSGRLSTLKEELSAPYPKELKENIIKTNMRIIDGDLESPFLKQLELAAKREDLVSQNHRLTALLSCYFDVLFAYNEVFHPGEKKLMKYAHLLCPLLPEDFDEDMIKMTTSTGDFLVEAVKDALKKLHAMLL